MPNNAQKSYTFTIHINSEHFSALKHLKNSIIVYLKLTSNRTLASQTV